MVNATQAMARLAEEFKTAQLSAENVQLSDTAIAAIAKALTSGENGGAVPATVINNTFNNSTVSQTSNGSTVVNTPLNPQNKKVNE